MREVLHRRGAAQSNTPGPWRAFGDDEAERLPVAHQWCADMQTQRAWGAMCHRVRLPVSFRRGSTVSCMAGA